MLLHKLRDDTVESFLAEDSVAESSAAAEQIHEIAWPGSAIRSSKENIRSSFSSTPAANKSHTSLPAADIHHNLSQYLGDLIRLLLQRLRLICIARC
jgi:hypothetical protein